MKHQMNLCGKIVKNLVLKGEINIENILEARLNNGKTSERTLGKNI